MTFLFFYGNIYTANIVKYGELVGAHLLKRKKEITMNNNFSKIKELTLPIVTSHSKELVDIKHRKEFGINIISIIIDDPQTFTMDIDEVANINSEILDTINDYIPDGYYLEVTTLGIERELVTDKDFERAIGKYIYVSTYQKLENAGNLKEINGYLLEKTNEEITIEALINQRKKVIIIPRAAIAKIRLAVKF